MPLNVISKAPLEIINDGFDFFNLKYKVVDLIENINIYCEFPHGDTFKDGKTQK